MSGEFLRLTSGEPAQLKDTYERFSIFIRASDVKSVSPHFNMQTWAGRTYGTVDGAYIEYGHGLSTFVHERAEEVIDLLGRQEA